MKVNDNGPNGSWVFYLMLWPPHHTAYIYKFICISHICVKYVKCFFWRSAWPDYCCLWVQRNGVDNKENWRLGRASYLYFCKSAVATGTFFWPDIASALPVMQHWFWTQLHPRGEASEAAPCSYWYTGVSAEMGCLAAGNNYFWNTGAVRLNWSLTCLSKNYS